MSRYRHPAPLGYVFVIADANKTDHSYIGWHRQGWGAFAKTPAADAVRRRAPVLVFEHLISGAPAFYQHLIQCDNAPAIPGRPGWMACTASHACKHVLQHIVGDFHGRVIAEPATVEAAQLLELATHLSADTLAWHIAAHLGAWMHGVPADTTSMHRLVLEALIDPRQVRGSPVQFESTEPEPLH